MTYPLIKPGVLEVYCGPMKSGKTREIINRVDKLNFISGSDFLFVKPKLDTRDEQIKSRFGKLNYSCIFVDEKNPDEIFSHIDKQHKLIVIDEAQFFSENIIDVIEKLLLDGKNVICAGLDLDFRGIGFGPMPSILSMANEVNKLTAVCEYPGCNNLASRTQRSINGKPAEYNSPIILVGDAKEGYEPRCMKHHFVPGKK